MTLTPREQRISFISVNGSIVIMAILFTLYYKYIRELPQNDCSMVTLMGLYCPSCGGTRAVAALFRFDVIGSFLNNPIVLAAFAYFVYYEAVSVYYLFKKAERKLLLSVPLVVWALALWGAFFVLRNVLLAFGIDMLGDILV